jgi:hypothetical protein
MGDMIGLPFGAWLFFTLFDFGNPDQVFALLGVLGLIISFLTLNSTRSFKVLALDVVCFIF